MLRIPEDELKCVRSGRQLDPRLRLAASEVKVLFVVGDRLVERERFVNVYEEVMVSRVWVLISGCVIPCFEDQSGTRRRL